MMDTLISGFADDYHRQLANSDINNDRLSDNSVAFTTGSFTNKLSKFTLATFDDEGNKKQINKTIIILYIYI